MLANVLPSLIALAVVSSAFPAQSATVPLTILPPNDQGWVRLSSPGQTGRVFQIRASTNLLDWTTIGTTHNDVSEYPDAATPLFAQRFYFLAATNRTGADDWKNQIHFPDDAFLSSGEGVFGADFRWIKFAIPLDEPARVYYQDSRKYEFHYDFAKARLERFKNLTPEQFDRIASRTNEQEVLLGTVLFPPFPSQGEFGIQFVGLDPYAPEFLARYYELVRATVASEPGDRAFYVPAYEQAQSAEANRAYFESRGIQLASPDRWLSTDDVYSTGWALGRLKFFKGTEINDAFRDGRLLPEDILLTDGVPAEIPVLAGVLTLTPSTPNSHVAILSKSFGLPFAYLSDPAQRERVQGLVGTDIFLRLNPFEFEVRIVELENSMDPAVRAEILALKAPPVLHIVPIAKRGALSAPTEQLTPADIKYFGGKASNFGFIRREIADRSQPAIGISFDLWQEFLDQQLPGKGTLRAEIEARLSKHSYPPNVAKLKDDLKAIRDLIKDAAQFTDAQKQAILTALGSFDRQRNVRFRSSTNVEDSEQFTGAGLYDSYSGCIADDLDSDDAGPSGCDPTEEEERGVFRAIKKVYASFYNDNAVIERLRHHLDESTVGMAMLVHHSAPDETELANGVATIQIRRPGDGSDDTTGDLVTQKGAVSVTNPDGNARPEVLSGYHHAHGAGGFLKQRSSLVPLGAYVMDWDKDYVELMELFARVGDAYRRFYPNRTEFSLDFEYKKLVPGKLDVKQVRQIPVIVPTNKVTAFLIHEPVDYWVYQGEAGDVFSNHRLKSFWALHSRNVSLSGSNLTVSLFADIDAQYLDNGQTNRLSGPPGSFPNASHAVESDYVIDRWTVGAGANREDMELRTQIRQQTTPTDAPVFVLQDFRVEWSVDFATGFPALEWDFDGVKQVTAKKARVVLEPRRPSPTDHLQERTFKAGQVKVVTQFYWPTPPSKGIGDKTAPLAGWKETRIEGLTSQPIVLHGDYSQTYRPGHHNFSEEFIFEPAFEGNLPEAVLGELRAANVQLIYALTNFDRQELRVLGVDGKFRILP